jgi:hypothetical protein
VLCCAVLCCAVLRCVLHSRLRAPEPLQPRLPLCHHIIICLPALPLWRASWPPHLPSAITCVCCLSSCCACRWCPLGPTRGGLPEGGHVLQGHPGLRPHRDLRRIIHRGAGSHGEERRPCCCLLPSTCLPAFPARLHCATDDALLHVLF